MGGEPRQTISLIIPAFNEERRLRPFMNTVARFVARHRSDFKEVIIVDDGSTDATLAEAERWKKRLEPLRVIKHEENRGKGAAIQTGVKAARGDLIVFMDADGATPIGELPKLQAALEEADVAIGNRWMRGAKTERTSSLRKLSGWVYRSYMRLFGLGRIDTMCGFKGYRAPIARDLFKKLLAERWLFDTEIAYRAHYRKYRIVNVPIRWTSQDGSKLSTGTLLKSALKILPLIRSVKKDEMSRQTFATSNPSRKGL